MRDFAHEDKHMVFTCIARSLSLAARHAPLCPDTGRLHGGARVSPIGVVLFEARSGSRVLFLANFNSMRAVVNRVVFLLLNPAELEPVGA